MYNMTIMFWLFQFTVAYDFKFVIQFSVTSKENTSKTYHWRKSFNVSVRLVWILLNSSQSFPKLLATNVGNLDHNKEFRPDSESNYYINYCTLVTLITTNRYVKSSVFLFT